MSAVRVRAAQHAMRMSKGFQAARHHAAHGRNLEQTAPAPAAKPAGRLREGDSAAAGPPPPGAWVTRHLLDSRGLELLCLDDFSLSGTLHNYGSPRRRCWVLKRPPAGGRPTPPKLGSFLDLTEDRFALHRAEERGGHAPFQVVEGASGAPVHGPRGPRPCRPRTGPCSGGVGGGSRDRLPGPSRR